MMGTLGMANVAMSFEGACLPPFLQESLFVSNTGFIAGRLCAPLGNVSCCLPCPQTDWLYPDNFDAAASTASWLNVAALLCSIFLLASFARLPVEKTHRHYLSICLAVATILMQLGFIIPLAAKPDQCADAITPNDMYSSRTCAISGALLILGGWCGVMWVFLRALALHLQICWQVVMGQAFMYGSFVVGWGIPVLGLLFALIFSGVSFRFGSTCHINHQNSLADFWIPLLTFAAATVIIQFATFAYCIKVYLASLDDDSTTTNSSGLPSYAGTVRTASPRQVYRRVRRVVELQWRGITIVLVIIADVVFFAIIFVFMDDSSTATVNDPRRALDWITCLVLAQGDKHHCLSYTTSLVVNEATVMAVLVLLSFNGIWALFFLGRFSMFRGWYELIKSKMQPKREFVSLDAITYVKDPRSYEMLASGVREIGSKTPEPVLTPMATTIRSGRRTPDYFVREDKPRAMMRSFQPSDPPGPRHPTSSVLPGSQAFELDPLGMNKI